MAIGTVTEQTGSLVLSPYYVSDTISVVLVRPQKNAEVGNIPGCVDADAEAWSSRTPGPGPLGLGVWSRLTPELHVLQSVIWSSK